MASTLIVRNAFNMTVKGKGAQARRDAFIAIAPHAYSEGMSRAQVVATIAAALGKSPTDGERAIAKSEYVIGRATARMPAYEMPKGIVDAADKLAFVRELVELYAAPVKDGVTPRPLRKGMKGRRTVAQQRVIRAAEEAWSQVLAETGHGKAQTQGQRNAAKAKGRAPAMAGSTARGKGSAPTPTHAELVKPVTAKSAADCVDHVVTQLAQLLAFTNKHAKLMPAGLASVIIHAKKEADKEAAAWRSINA